MSYSDDMPRKRFPINIDTRLIDGVKAAAAEAGLSINGYMEQLLTGHLKNLGKLPMNAPPLPEARGGHRPGAGKRKSSGEEGSADQAPDSTQSVDGNPGEGRR